jgi:hypothetical protein
VELALHARRLAEHRRNEFITFRDFAIAGLLKYLCEARSIDELGAHGMAQRESTKLTGIS